MDIFTPTRCENCIRKNILLVTVHAANTQLMRDIARMREQSMEDLPPYEQSTPQQGNS